MRPTVTPPFSGVARDHLVVIDAIETGVGYTKALIDNSPRPKCLERLRCRGAGFAIRRSARYRRRMIDYLRIHVLWADGSTEGERVAQLLSTHFDGLGMERDGVAHRVPVRFVSHPWEAGSTLPAPVDFERSARNAIVVLHDDYMHENRQEWAGYLEDLHVAMAARSGVDLYILFGSPHGEPAPASDQKRLLHHVHRDKWSALGGDAQDKRLLLHLLFQIRRHLRGTGVAEGGEPLFVSHAKADGDTTAKAIVDFVGSTDHDVPLHTFYDAMELNPGEDFKARFEREIGQGTLIAIVSDVYDSRPWCVFELTTAKRHRRPIVLADVGGVRISRTFPYGANLPRVRVLPGQGRNNWIEPLLVEALSEGLRCDLFNAQAIRALPEGSDALVLPRPPELFDIIDVASVPDLIVYPDPPLGEIEEGLLTRALEAIQPCAKLITMGELMA